MEHDEATRHNARRQTLKVLEHLRLARHELNKGNEHLNLIRRAGQASALVLLDDKLHELGEKFDRLYTDLNLTFGYTLHVANDIQLLMTHPNHTPPPIVGKYAQKTYSKLTPLQRHLVRSGQLKLDDPSDVPTHAWTEAPRKEPRVKIVTDFERLDIEKKQKAARAEVRRKANLNKDSRMPL